MTLLALEPLWIGLGVVGLFFLILIFWFVGGYNGLVRMRNETRNQWSQIDVQLKRRHDLIPNLVSVVKDYMAFEQETLENVTKARNVAMGAASQGPGAQAAAENGLSRALAGLYVVMENYPELKANKNVSELQEELTSTENRIAYSRQAYNDSVMRYDTAREQIPTNIVAGMCGFRQEFPMWKTEEAEKAAPKVSLR
ncbi:MAG: LemA family protein [Planctomycetota bacterium]|nr:LemA family protein [Planctomycetota bacterium]